MDFLGRQPEARTSRASKEKETSGLLKIEMSLGEEKINTDYESFSIDQ
jgi:hypothetical protein